jgi:FMN reductase
MTSRTLTTISAGLGKPSASRLLADRLTAAAVRALEAQGVTPDTRVIELRDHAHDLVNAMLTGVPTGGLPGVIDATVHADGLIVVTPIFNASYSGLFKTFFDVLEPGSLTGKPVLIAATGDTPRHSLVIDHAMRPLFSYLRSVVIPTGVYAASQDWGEDRGGDALTERIERAAGELAELLGNRTPAVPADPYAFPTPFERLLAAGSTRVDARG